MPFRQSVTITPREYCLSRYVRYRDLRNLFLYLHFRLTVFSFSVAINFNPACHAIHNLQQTDEMDRYFTRLVRYLPSIQTSTGAHLVSKPMGAEVTPLEVKRQRREVGNSSTPCANVKNTLLPIPVLAAFLSGSQYCGGCWARSIHDLHLSSPELPASTCHCGRKEERHQTPPGLCRCGNFVWVTYHEINDKRKKRWLARFASCDFTASSVEKPSVAPEYLLFESCSADVFLNTTNIININQNIIIFYIGFIYYCHMHYSVTCNSISANKASAI
jgi:hypothetical protein